jgi:hypothetical protein
LFEPGIGDILKERGGMGVKVKPVQPTIIKDKRYPARPGLLKMPPEASPQNPFVPQWRTKFFSVQIRTILYVVKGLLTQIPKTSE